MGAKSLWLDEGATVALARASWQHFAWVWWHGEANLQTIYFLLMRGWIHLGSSEAWLRSPSALFGIASIPLMYVVARKFTGRHPSLAAAALLAFSPTHVFYSQEARSYTLAILLVLLSTYFFVRAVEDERMRGTGRCGRSVSIAAFTVTTSPLWCWSLRRCRCCSKRHRYRGGRAILCGAIIFARGGARAHLCFSRLTGKPAFHLDAASEC